MLGDRRGSLWTIFHKKKKKKNIKRQTLTLMGNLVTSSFNMDCGKKLKYQERTFKEKYTERHQLPIKFDPRNFWLGH